MNKLYSIGIQNFESLRKDGYFYVDNTALISSAMKQVDSRIIAIKFTRKQPKNPKRFTKFAEIFL